MFGGIDQHSGQPKDLMLKTAFSMKGYVLGTLFQNLTHYTVNPNLVIKCVNKRL